MFRYLWGLFVVLGFGGALLGCKTTGPTGNWMWESRSDVEFPILFDPGAIGGSRGKALQVAIPEYERLVRVDANRYRLTLSQGPHRLVYLYAPSNPGYGWAPTKDLAATARELSGDRAISVESKGTVSIGPAVGHYIVWRVPGRSCLFVEGAFGDIMADNRNDFAGENRMTAFYCGPASGNATSATVGEIAAAVSIRGL